MSTSPLPPPSPGTSNNLAKLAILFAAVFVLAFGLCAAGFGVDAGGSRYAGYLIGTSFVVEAICFVGLLTVGVIGLIRIIRR
jgi:hypothetical protein